MQKAVRIRLVWCLCTIIGLIFLWWLYDIRSKSALPSRQPHEAITEISVVAPQGENVTTTDIYLGRVDAINNTDIVPYISGYITDIAVKGGQEVKKGDVLLRLKPEEYIAAFAAAKASLFAAKADLVNAKIKYERMKKAGTKVVSATELDDAKAAYMAAEGALAKAKAELYAAKINLQYTELVAPFDGVLGNIAPSLGDYISPQSRNLMHLVQYDPIRVVFSLSDKEFLHDISQRSEAPTQVKVQLADGTILPENGVIKYMANEVDTNTNTIAVYSEFANKKHLLMPNAFVRILLQRAYENVILLSKNRLLMKADGNFIYTVKNGILQLHKLSILGNFKAKVVVRNDFTPEEMLVTETVDARLVGKKVATRMLHAEKK